MLFRFAKDIWLLGDVVRGTCQKSLRIWHSASEGAGLVPYNQSKDFFKAAADAGAAALGRLFCVCGWLYRSYLTQSVVRLGLHILASAPEEVQKISLLVCVLQWSRSRLLRPRAVE